MLLSVASRRATSNSGPLGGRAFGRGRPTGSVGALIGTRTSTGQGKAGFKLAHCRCDL